MGHAEELPTGEAFRPEWIDFGRGIRVGNLHPHERVTQILKFHLEQRYQTPFVTDRWGRGVYWQWICWLPRANREAKPVSHHVNFGCSKLFISVDQDKRIFKAGLQIERGYMTGPEAEKPWGLREDFDWHRLVKECRSNTVFDREVRRLAREGFVATPLGEGPGRERFRSAAELRSALQRCRPDHWAGFQLYYPIPERELHACTGYELVKSITGIFTEIIPAMNCCMEIQLPQK